MKKDPLHPASPDSDAFIGEIHQVEEKINEFLASRRKDAERIVEEGRRAAERVAEEGRGAAAEEGAALAAGILEKARAEAAGIEARGRKDAEALEKETAPRRDGAKALVRDHLLGRAP